METDVSTTDILEALADVMGRGIDGPGVTVRELQAVTGRGPGYIRDALKVLLRARQIVVTRVQITDLSGRRTWVPAYRPIDRLGTNT